MNLTKTEAATALQNMLNARYGSGKYTVGAGVEYVQDAAQLEYDMLDAYHIANNLVSQSMFYGTLHIAAINASQPAEVEAVLSQKQQQINGVEITDTYGKVVSAEIVAPVGKTTTVDNAFFAYIDGARYSGHFNGYMFEVTTIRALQQDGTLAVNEAGQPYDAV